jgi:hypothetical protein
MNMPIDDKVFRLTISRDSGSAGARGSAGAPSGADAPGHGGASGAGGPLAKVLTWVVGGVALVGALVFSAALFVVLLVVGAAVGGWLWWQTRALRRQLRAQMEQMRQQAGPGPTPQGAGPVARPGAGEGARAGAGAFRRSAPVDGEIIDGDFIREAPATKTDASPTAQQDAPPSPRASAHERRDER